MCQWHSSAKMDKPEKKTGTGKLLLGKRGETLQQQRTGVTDQHPPNAPVLREEQRNHDFLRIVSECTEHRICSRARRKHERKRTGSGPKEST